MTTLVAQLITGIVIICALLVGQVAWAERPKSAASGGNSQQDKARQRESAAEEDPLSQRALKKRQEKRVGPEPKPKTFGIYTSLRLRYRQVDGGSVWGDGGSRVGASATGQINPSLRLFARAEAGFNLLDELDQVFQPSGSSNSTGDDSVFKRLLYAGVETPQLFTTFGKNWSTYHQVASFTDRFDASGGAASGVYNAGTDGGAVGTGRADRVLQARFLYDFLPKNFPILPFDLNVQIQRGERIPHVADASYGTAVGLSAILKTQRDYTIGIAYNYAEVRDNNAPRFRAAGIDGNAGALLLGTRWFGDNWYLGTTFSFLENIETTDQGIYFDGNGWELYSQRRLKGPVWLVAGVNYLKPDDDDKSLVGEYEVKYAVLGLRYDLGKKGRKIYLEGRHDAGANTDGSDVDNVVTLGFRWDLSR